MQKLPASIPSYLWLLIALPFLVHFTLLFFYAVNAPRLDDFPEILTFLPDWHAAANIDEKINVLFRDYQNHRYVLYHAVLIGFDHINFRTAAIVGNLPLILLCGLMMACVAKHPQRNMLWVITPLLILNLQSWRAMFWGPLGTTNLLYPMMGLLACYLTTQGTRGVIAAGCTAVLLTLSHGSGPLLFPVIAVYLYLQWRSQSCHTAVFIGWILLSILTCLLYFVIFPLQRDAGYSSHNSVELLQNIFVHTTDIIKGFLALLGSHLMYDGGNTTWKSNLAIALGAIELLWLGFLISRGVLRDAPALLLWLAFLLLTAASIAIGRVAYAGIDQAMQGHYKLLNGIMLWFLMVATLRWKPASHLLAFAFVSALYTGGVFLFLSPMQNFQQALMDDVIQWQKSGKLKDTETWLYVKQPNLKIKAAIDGGFYNPDE